MIESKTKQVMMGMVNAGKTTFLAALYHVVETGEVANSLQLVSLPENRAYVIDKKNEWLGCKPFERTKLGQEQKVEMILKDPKNGKQIELSFPDLSGETFRDQWEHRRSTKFVNDLLKEAQGILLFIQPEFVNKASQINDMLDVSSLIDGIAKEEIANEPKQADSQDSESKHQDTVKEWSPSTAPMQVKTVELLQFLMREPDVYGLQNLAVIISAWDLCKNQYDAPSAWLNAQMPLLAQYLGTNTDRLTSKIFGISAQGGRLGQDDLQMRSANVPSHRIQVITDIVDEFDEHDISAPIKWLMTRRSAIDD